MMYILECRLSCSVPYRWQAGGRRRSCKQLGVYDQCAVPVADQWSQDPAGWRVGEASGVAVGVRLLAVAVWGGVLLIAGQLL